VLFSGIFQQYCILAAVFTKCREVNNIKQVLVINVEELIDGEECIGFLREVY
jgi:hypothetical protein